MDYVSALKYPLKDTKNFLISFALGVIWWTIIPVFFLLGYLIEFIKSSLDETIPLPKWSLATSKVFLFKGVSAFAILLVYLLPPLIVGSGAVSLSTSSTLGTILYWISFILLLVVMFLLPTSLIVYAATDNIWKALDLGEILPLISSRLYPYVKVYFVSIVAYIVGLLLAIVPLVNILFGGIIFYMTLFSYYLFARALQQ
jgi:hypothetical protein